MWGWVMGGRVLRRRRGVVLGGVGGRLLVLRVVLRLGGRLCLRGGGDQLLLQRAHEVRAQDLLHLLQLLRVVQRGELLEQRAELEQASEVAERAALLGGADPLLARPLRLRRVRALLLALRGGRVVRGWQVLPGLAQGNVLPLVQQVVLGLRLGEVLHSGRRRRGRLLLRDDQHGFGQLLLVAEMLLLLHQSLLLGLLVLLLELVLSVLPVTSVAADITHQLMFQLLEGLLRLLNALQVPRLVRLQVVELRHEVGAREPGGAPLARARGLPAAPLGLLLLLLLHLLLLKYMLSNGWGLCSWLCCWWL